MTILILYSNKTLYVTTLNTLLQNLYHISSEKQVFIVQNYNVLTESNHNLNVFFSSVIIEGCLIMPKI